MKPLTIVSIVVTALTATVFSQTTERVNSIIPADFSIYAKMSRSDLEQSFESIDAERINLENQIASVIKDNVSNQEKVAAVRLAGIYRLERVASDLAQIITLKDEHYVRVLYLTRWGQFPAVDALVDIGDPSIAPLLNNLATNNDPEARRLSIIAIGNIMMSSTAAKAILQEEIQRQAEAKNDAAVARLKAAIPLLDPPQ